MTFSGGQKQFIEACTACGLCLNFCPFLQIYGTPDVIIAERPAEAFLCTNCGACNQVCPEGLDPAQALWETKRRLIQNKDIPERVDKALRNARSFARTARRFPLRFYPSHATVFWPGCGLAGTSPSLVKKIRSRLEQRLGEKVGIVLDCCSDPVYQMGDEDRVVEACRHIRERLIRGKITRIITGCPNCRKIFTTHFPEMQIDFALDLLRDDLVLDNLPPMVFLHHPCPVMKFETSRRNIEDWIGQHRSMEGPSSLVACCGNGGRLPALSRNLADRFTRKITAQAKDRPILTYCTGCNHRFHAEGKMVYHLLGFLPGAAPAMRQVSMRKRWWNRFLLSMEQHIKSSKENKRGSV